MTLIYILAYLIVGLLWAQFSYEVDKIICPYYDKKTKILLYVVTLLFFPIPMLSSLLTSKYTINNIQKKIIENFKKNNK